MLRATHLDCLVGAAVNGGQLLLEEQIVGETAGGGQILLTGGGGIGLWSRVPLFGILGGDRVCGHVAGKKEKRSEKEKK